MPKATVMFVATTAVGGGGTVVEILFAGGGGVPFGACGPFGSGGPVGAGKSTLAFVDGGLFGDYVLALFAEGG